MTSTCATILTELQQLVTDRDLRWIIATNQPSGYHLSIAYKRDCRWEECIYHHGNYYIEYHGHGGSCARNDKVRIKLHSSPINDGFIRALNSDSVLDGADCNIGFADSIAGSRSIPPEVTVRANPILMNAVCARTIPIEEAAVLDDARLDLINYADTETMNYQSSRGHVIGYDAYGDGYGVGHIYTENTDLFVLSVGFALITTLLICMCLALCFFCGITSSILGPFICKKRTQKSNDNRSDHDVSEII